jgi:hypothetical protein
VIGAIIVVALVVAIGLVAGQIPFAPSVRRSSAL